MKRTLIGYFILRTVVNRDSVRGKTFSAYAHKLYPSRELAAKALDDLVEYDMLDPRFEYNVTEAWMGDEP